MKICFIKFGGGLITDKSKPFSFNENIVQRLAKQIVLLRANYPEYKWVIGTGAGSFGHYLAKKTGYKDNSADLVSASQIHQSVVKLNSMVNEELQKLGLPVFGVSPSSFIIQNNDKYFVNIESIVEMLKKSIIPVVHGDVIINSASTTRIISTEEVFDLLGNEIKTTNIPVLKVIYLTSTNGVLDGGMKTIDVINKNSAFDVQSSKNFDVTGGMKQKVEMAIKALDFADRVHIVSGKDDSLLSIFDDMKAGTEVVA